MVMLIVEDDRGIATLVRVKAEASGFEVVCVYSGMEAIEFLAAGTPHLVVFDYTLPDMNTVELLAGLEERGIAVPPFIVATGQGDERIAVDMMKRGARDYIVKDAVFLEMLPTVLQRVCREIQYEHDRRQAEAERELLERQLQHAQKLESLGVLAGGIAHDFNNLFAVILGNAELALDVLGSGSPAVRNISAIETATRRAAGLAQQMLAYSGRGCFVIEPVDAGKLIKEMGHLLQSSVSRRSVLEFKLADNLATFKGDATQICQIIMNLITNASEAIGDGHGVITLSTGTLDCDRAYLDGCNEIARAAAEPLLENRYVYFEVADTGSGMDAATVEKIFDPFYTTKFAGRGLGMSAVLGIVRGHKGAIRIISTLGKGTIIRVLFPCGEAVVDRGAAVPATTLDADWRGSGAVLLADDEESVRAVGREMLELLGFEVLTASDGALAVEMFRRHMDEIVCVLLDLTMPYLDGIEAFHEIRRIRPDVKVLLLSGYNEQDAGEYVAESGTAGFIKKPYTLVTLQQTMHAVLEGS